MGKRKLISESSGKKKKERQKKLRKPLAESKNRIPAEIEPNNLNTPFCTQMANKVLLEQIEKGRNIVLSPLSFQLMLSLIAVGSKGRTLQQILSHLGSSNIDNLNELSSQIVHGTLKSNHDQKGPRIAFGNGLWVDQRFGLNPLFKKVVKDTYKAKAKAVDFATKADRVCKKVNLWVKKETQGLITDILPSRSVNSKTALVFANALYFKGEWDQKLKKNLTTKRTFHLMDGKTVKVPFMTSYKDKKYLYKTFDGYKVLAIPYKKGEDTRRFSMYFFLPDEINGLPNLLQKINSNPNFLSQKFNLCREEMENLWIPKFKFSFEFEASKTIKEMGIDLIFMEDVTDFSAMVDSLEDKKVYLSNVFHKSFIEVNEDGTEAGASISFKTMLKCRRVPQLSFIADHPFLFMIRENVSRVMLFTGAVMNPL